MRRIGLFWLGAVCCCLSGGLAGSTRLPHHASKRGPVFTYEPPPHTVLVNNLHGYVVQCLAQGSPPPVMDWTANGVSIEGRGDLLQVLPNNSLYIRPFMGVDGRNVHRATYRCVAENSGGKIVSRRLSLKPVITQDVAKYTVQVSDLYTMVNYTAVFKCKISPAYAIPYVQVLQWMSKGVDARTDKRLTVTPEGYLLVPKVQPSDDGRSFRCVTQYVLNRTVVLSSEEARLNVIPQTYQDLLFEYTRPVVRVKFNRTARLPCVASGYPEPKYTWNKGKTPIPQSLRVHQEGSTLIIRHAQYSDSGTYNCSVTTSSKNTKFKETKVVVTDPLGVRLEPSRNTVDAGHNATLRCHVRGWPINKVVWYKDGARLNPQALAEGLTLSADLRSLTIANMTRAQSGMYQCFAENDDEESQGTAQVILGASKPVFTSSQSSDMSTDERRKISLRCTAHGNPFPAISWTLDEAPVVPNSGLQVESILTPEGDVVSYVNITSVGVMDGGRYVCTAVNEMGSVSRSFHLKVSGPLRVKPMDPVVAIANRTLRLQCHVTGHPFEPPMWWKDGNKLRTNLRMTVNSEGLLTIMAAIHEEDSGEYQCTAGRAPNEVAASESVKVTIITPPSIHLFDIPELVEGKTVSFICQAEGDKPMKFTLLKDGVEIPPEGHPGISYYEVGASAAFVTLLDISVAQHNGVYSCVATNKAASDTKSVLGFVKVKPYWVVKPANNYAILGQDVVMDCQSAGIPQPNITWMYKPRNHHNSYASFGEETEHTHVFPNGSLLIRSAEKSDATEYLCKAENGVRPPLSQAATLVIHIPARFSTSSANYTLVKGSAALIHCQAEGDHPMTIAWSKGGYTIANGDRYNITGVHAPAGFKKSVLEIKETGRRDSGDYVCRATNQYGTASQLARVIITEKPNAPVLVKIDAVTSRSFQLVWKVPFDGNLPLLTYTIQYRFSSDDWTEAKVLAVPANQTSVTLSDLLPYRSYTVRTLSSNRLGSSTPSAPLSRLTGEEAPTGPPMNVTLKAVTSRAINISWQPPSRNLQNGKITSYTLEYKPYNSSQDYSVINLPANRFHGSYVLDSLLRFSKYTVVMSARTVKGRGPRSEPQSAVTLEDVPSQAPENVRVYRGAQESSVIVLWDSLNVDSLHGILKGYKVLYTPVRNDEDEAHMQTKVSNRLETELTDLDSFTNYSIQVLAYTGKGEGARSPPQYITTPPAEPSNPSAVLLVPQGPTSLIVAWKVPEEQNGNFEKYRLRLWKAGPRRRSISATGNPEREVYITKENYTQEYSFGGLGTGQLYSVSLASKNERTGYGPDAQSASAAPLTAAPARIVTFPQRLIANRRKDVTLHCHVVGQPAPTVTWTISGNKVDKGLLPNGSLVLPQVDTSDSGNYTCTTENSHGVDSIVSQLMVRVDKSASPPKPPAVFVVSTGFTSVQLKWSARRNGGSRITGFLLDYKPVHGKWKRIRLSPKSRSHIMDELMCGSSYFFKMKAINSIGESIESSQSVRVRTRGTEPVAPDQSNLLKTINSTYVDVDLESWQDGGCPITHFFISYKRPEESSWSQLNVEMGDLKFKHVEDLQFATWYSLTVRATNEAGSQDASVSFATLMADGSPLPAERTDRTRHVLRPAPHQEPYVVIPLVSSGVLLILALLAVLLYFKRKRASRRLKEMTTQNYRNNFSEGEAAPATDALAPNAMNDLDKSSTTYSGSAIDRVRLGSRNRNVSCGPPACDMPPESVSHESQMWLLHRHQSGLTESDNMCVGHAGEEVLTSDSDDDGDDGCSVNKQKFVSDVTLPGDSEEEDEIDRQKRKNKEYEALFPDADFPPPPHELLATLVEDPEESSPHNMKKFASEKRLHYAAAKPTKPDLRPNTTGPYPPVAGGASGEDPTNPSLARFKSFLSSMTTVSSNQEELLMAYQNSKLHPLSPIVFESPTVAMPPTATTTPSSRPTPEDSSDHMTESGILQFTQLPPRPEEQRQAVCEVPLYSGAGSRRLQGTPMRSGHRGAAADLSSDTTTTTDHEVPGSAYHHSMPPRHKSPQKRSYRRKAKALTGSQRKLRAHSRTSSRSKSRMSERGYDEACDLIGTLTKSYVRAESPSEEALNPCVDGRARSAGSSNHGYTYHHPARQKKKMISPSCIANQSEEKEPLMGDDHHLYHNQPPPPRAMSHTLPSAHPQHAKSCTPSGSMGKPEDAKLLDRYYRAFSAEQKSPSPCEYTDKFTIV